MKGPAEHPETLRLLVGFLRSYVRMSQTELGQAARISQGQISAFDTGTKKPTDDFLRRIATAAGVPWPLIPPLRHFISDFLTLVERGGPILEIANPFESLAVQAYLLEEAAAESSRDSPAQLQREAETFWAVVANLPVDRRRRVVELSPRASRNWALAQLLCQESRKVAAQDSREARELADLALSIAQRVPEGGEKTATVEMARRVIAEVGRELLQDF